MWHARGQARWLLSALVVRFSMACTAGCSVRWQGVCNQQSRAVLQLPVPDGLLADVTVEREECGVY